MTEIMEDDQQVRRKYKKHKTDYKISIKYKLNTVVKMGVYQHHTPLYPLYVEVITRRKRVFFPSRYYFLIPINQLELFLQNDLIKSLLDHETSKITECIRKAESLAESPEKELTWLPTYHASVFDERLSEQLRAKIRERLTPVLTSQTGLDVIYHGLDAKNYLQPTLDLILYYKEPWRNKKEVIEAVEMLRNFVRISHFLRMYSKDWFYGELDISFDLLYAESYLLFDNQPLRKKISNMKHSDAFFTDLEELRKYIF